jgi:hypothetical protein
MIDVLGPLLELVVGVVLVMGRILVTWHVFPILELAVDDDFPNRFAPERLRHKGHHHQQSFQDFPDDHGRLQVFWVRLGRTGVTEGISVNPPPLDISGL